MEILIGTLQRLEYAHRNGIVHRDIEACLDGQPVAATATATAAMSSVGYGGCPTTN
ncbi:hypothetical protein [Streptomyces sp. DG1A-41]|uniref:hypothetical protein n=1 Tax=Streptomyces sp. DG1A-41 TaxID=3125779 RepID=UPI0030D45AE7